MRKRSMHCTMLSPKAALVPSRCFLVHGATMDLCAGLDRVKRDMLSPRPVLDLIRHAPKQTRRVATWRSSPSVDLLQVRLGRPYVWVIRHRGCQSTYRTHDHECRATRALPRSRAKPHSETSAAGRRSIAVAILSTGPRILGSGTSLLSSLTR